MDNKNLFKKQVEKALEFLIKKGLFTTKKDSNKSIRFERNQKEELLINGNPTIYSQIKNG